MTISAEITDGIVTNIIVGTLPGYVECQDEVGIGWLYDEKQGFSPPPPPHQPLSERKAEMVALIKTEAEQRILERYPEWKQRNMTSRLVAPCK